MLFFGDKIMEFYGTRTKCDVCEKRRLCDVSHPKEPQFKHGQSVSQTRYKPVRFAICRQCNKDR
jgi:hypothetical protein